MTGIPRALVATIAAVTACVAMPLERSNYFDPESGSTLTITGAPDTLFSMRDTFTLAVTSEPDFPTGAGAVWSVVSGAALVQSLGGTTFRTTDAVGLLPVPLLIRVYAAPVGSPADTVRIMVRQRPATVDLLCNAGSNCAGLSSGALATLRFTMTDAHGLTVNLPAGSYRWGTITSRSPGIVSVVDRLLPNTISVQGSAAGSAWLVLAGEGIADSILVTVVP